VKVIGQAFPASWPGMMAVLGGGAGTKDRWDFDCNWRIPVMNKLESKQTSYAKLLGIRSLPATTPHNSVAPRFPATP
jgi:hypothetical protein